MAAWKEHKKDKLAVLHLIGEFLERPVKRSADLSDEEAERVFAHLQTLSAQWSAEKKPEQTKIVYNQKNRAHRPELADEMDNKIQKLTVLGVTAAEMSNMIRELILKEVSGREIAHRYELTDDEAEATIEFLKDRIAEKECERAVAADEV